MCAELSSTVRKTHPLLLSADPAALFFFSVQSRDIYGGVQHFKTAALISGVLRRMSDHVARTAELMMDEALGGTLLLTLSAPVIDL